jgi:hypothetical protein
VSRVRLDRSDWTALWHQVVWRQECACGCGRNAESAHHLVPRGKGGDDVEENLVPLAGHGTTLCHGAITASQRMYDLASGEYVDPDDVRHGLRAYLDAHTEKRDYIVGETSQAWLDTTYPEGE